MRKKTAGILVLIIGVYLFSSSLLLGYYLLRRKEPPNLVREYSELLLFSDISCNSLTWEQVRGTPISSLCLLFSYGLLGFSLTVMGLLAIFTSEIDKNLIRKLQNRKR